MPKVLPDEPQTVTPSSKRIYCTADLTPPPPPVDCPGVLNECEVILPKVLPDDPQTFAFVIAKGVEMSALFNLAVQGGTASM